MHEDLGVQVGVQVGVTALGLSVWRYAQIQLLEKVQKFLERAIRRGGSCIFVLPPPTFPSPCHSPLCSPRLSSSRQGCQTRLLLLRGLVPGSFPWKGWGERVPLVPHNSISQGQLCTADRDYCGGQQEAPAPSKHTQQDYS